MYFNIILFLGSIFNAVNQKLTTSGAKKMIKEKLVKLLDVKSLVTLILSSVFAYLSFIEKINTEQFLTVFTTVIAFYFGTQQNKGDQK